MSWRFDIALPDVVAASRSAAALELALTGTELLKRVGAEVRHEVVKHLEALPPNKQFPGETTGFYKDAAQSVHEDVLAEDSGGGTVTVSINHQGMRQRLLGGTIYPVHGTYLAIPKREEAYGKSPRDPYWADKLRFAVLSGLGPVLVERERSKLKIGRKRKDGSQSVKSGGAEGGGVMYQLVKSAHQDPDPSVVPTKERIEEVVGNATREFIAERMKR